MGATLSTMLPSLSAPPLTWIRHLLDEPARAIAMESIVASTATSHRKAPFGLRRLIAHLLGRGPFHGAIGPFAAASLAQWRWALLHRRRITPASVWWALWPSR